MNWTRPSKRRIATPRRDDSEDAAPGWWDSEVMESLPSWVRDMMLRRSYNTKSRSYVFPTV
jgi:hypothetical protein